MSWDAHQLADRLQTKVGQPYDFLLAREDLNFLGGIMDRAGVRTEPLSSEELRVVFSVREFPVLRKFQVIGNRSLSTERIIHIAGIEENSVIQEDAVRSLRRKLRQEYRNLGLTTAKINVEVSGVFPEEAATDALMQFSQADIQVVIDEGEQIKVDDLIIEGNEAFPAWRLRLLLDTKGSWWFLKNHYDPAAFEEDLIRLRNFYKSEGYFDAIVERGLFEERRVKGKISVSPVIKIAEGEKYRLESVEVRGARHFSREEILEPFEPLLGKEFHGAKFARAMDQVRALYHDNGYLSTRIRQVPDYDSETRQTRMALEIDENVRIYVGKVELARPRYEIDKEPGFFQRYYDRVAPPISDEAIRREILLKPGEVYNRSKERDSLRRLEQLGLFAKVEIVGQPTTDPKVQDVLVSIEEANTGDFFGGVGFGDIGGGFIFASINERNLFGDARDLKAQIQLGTRASNVTITYRDRHFKDTEDTLIASLFYNTFRREGYSERVFGTNVERVQPIYGDWLRGLRVRLEGVSLEEDSGTDADEDLDTSYPVFTGRLQFTQDTRYPIRNPTEGRLLRAGVEAGYADGPLLKFTYDGEYNRQLSPKLTYRFMPTLGLIPYDSGEVGLTERFFLGGNNDLRGFKYRGAGRRDKKEDEVGIGGAVKILLRNELGFPLYEPVSGVVFLDVGTLGKNPFSYETPRMSIGFGLRMAMPRASVALDFALPILKEGGDETQFLHFSFRSSF